MQTEKEIAQNAFGSRRCDACGHVRVCGGFRAIAPLIASFPEGARPFETEDLAKICGEFIDAGAIRVLSAVKDNPGDE